MKTSKIKLLSTAVVPALAVAGLAVGSSEVSAAPGYGKSEAGCGYSTRSAELPAAKSRDGYIQLAACNPCAAKKACNPCNPCAAKACNPCNPCAAKGACNPCAAKNPCNPCNPCAAKKN